MPICEPPENVDCKETRIAYGCYSNKRRNPLTDAVFLHPLYQMGRLMDTTVINWHDWWFLMDEKIRLAPHQQIEPLQTHYSYDKILSVSRESQSYAHQPLLESIYWDHTSAWSHLPNPVRKFDISQDRINLFGRDKGYLLCPARSALLS
jgi:hypothetical protein